MLWVAYYLRFSAFHRSFLLYYDRGNLVVYISCIFMLKCGIVNIVRNRQKNELVAAERNPK